MNKKWNISIIVTFILALVSLLALLSANYTREIVNNAGTLKNYYKTYYLANAWIETSLVAINQYWFWFEEKISSWNKINENFDCNQIDCYFTSNIKSIVHFNESNDIFINNWDNDICNEDNAITLERWETYSIPLFYDPNKWDTNLLVVSKLQKDMDIEIENIWKNKLFAISISLGDWRDNLHNRQKLVMTWTINDISINWFLHELHLMQLNTWEIPNSWELVYNFWNQTSVILPISSTFHQLNNYLLISNLSDINDPKIAQFCIKINNEKSELVSPNIVITSQWKFANQTVWLQAKKSVNIPDFLFNTLLDR